MSWLAIETGGTKIVARALAVNGMVMASGRWPTTTPEAALTDLVTFARSLDVTTDPLGAVGIAAFGPILIDAAGLEYGKMLATAKPGWTGSNLRAELDNTLNIPVAVDTDVNAAATAERELGAGQGCTSVAYVTIGTGIGAGLATATGTLRGALHPEIGHLRIVRRRGDTVPSTCPFHDDCAEGLAAGPAVAQRLGTGETLIAREDVRDLTAGYIAQLLVAIVLAWSPHRIVIGGGIGSAPSMLAAIRSAFAAAVRGYGIGPAAIAADFIRPAMLEDAGLEGALLIAQGLARARLKDFA